MAMCKDCPHPRKCANGCMMQAKGKGKMAKGGAPKKGSMVLMIGVPKAKKK